MKWLIEIVFDTTGKAISRTPTITADAGDEVVWFVQSQHKREFQVELEEIRDPSMLDVSGLVAALSTIDLGTVPVRRKIESPLGSASVEAVRLVVPRIPEGMLTGYRIRVNGDVFTDAAFTGAIAVRPEIVAEIGGQTEEPRPER